MLVPLLDQVLWSSPVIAMCGCIAGWGIGDGHGGGYGEGGCSVMAVGLTRDLIFQGVLDCGGIAAGTWPEADVSLGSAVWVSGSRIVGDSGGLRLMRATDS